MDSPGKIKQINSMEDLNKLFKDDTPKLVVLEYMVPWSELCKFMDPAVVKMARKYKDHADFYKLDVDKWKDHARGKGVEVLPTFLLLKNGKECKRIIGINKTLLDRSIEEQSGASDLQSDDDNDPEFVEAKESNCIIL